MPKRYATAVTMMRVVTARMLLMAQPLVMAGQQQTQTAYSGSTLPAGIDYSNRSSMGASSAAATRKSIHSSGLGGGHRRLSAPPFPRDRNGGLRYGI